MRKRMRQACDSQPFCGPGDRYVAESATGKFPRMTSPVVLTPKRTILGRKHVIWAMEEEFFFTGEETCVTSLVTALRTEVGRLLRGRGDRQKMNIQTDRQTHRWTSSSLIVPVRWAVNKLEVEVSETDLVHGVSTHLVDVCHPVGSSTELRLFNVFSSLCQLQRLLIATCLTTTTSSIHHHHIYFAINWTHNDNRIQVVITQYSSQSEKLVLIELVA